jgi:hypothetical protein
MVVAAVLPSQFWGVSVRVGVSVGVGVGASVSVRLNECGQLSVGRASGTDGATNHATLPTIQFVRYIITFPTLLKTTQISLSTQLALASHVLCH